MKTDLVFTGFMYSIRQTVISLTWARVVMECVFFWSVTIECVMSAIESPTDHDLWPLPFNISNALQSVNIIPKTPHHIMQTNHRTDFIICFCFFPRHITVVLNSHFWLVNRCWFIGYKGSSEVSYVICYEFFCLVFFQVTVLPISDYFIYYIVKSTACVCSLHYTVLYHSLQPPIIT